MFLLVIGQVLAASIDFPILTQLLGNLCVHDDIEGRTFDVLTICHSGGIAVQVRHAQVMKKFGKCWEVYIGGENLTNFKQKYPIISAENPTSEDFDASMVWGPLSGIRAYLGVRFQLK